MNKILNILLFLLVIGYAAYYVYKMPKYKNGQKAPQFKTELMDGNTFELKELEGKYVLLDFWGSWCGPCRRENRAIVDLYNKYNNATFDTANGFEVVSIGVENREKSWKQAIAKDGLIWKFHIAQMDRFKSPIVSQYGVKEIPTKYLLNAKGEIIGVNLSTDEIDRMLSRRLKDL